MHAAPQHSFTRSFIHPVKVLTVEYFMCDNTTNEDELHSETLLFPNGTPQSRSFGRETEGGKMLSLATGNVLLQQPAGNMKRQSCCCLYLFTMCLQLLYVLTFEHTTCSTFKTTFDRHSDDKGKQWRVSRSQDSFPALLLVS